MYVGVGMYVLDQSCASPTCSQSLQCQTTETSRHGLAVVSQPRPLSWLQMDQSVSLICWAPSRVAEPRILNAGAGVGTTRMLHEQPTTTGPGRGPKIFVTPCLVVRLNCIFSKCLFGHVYMQLIQEDFSTKRFQASIIVVVPTTQISVWSDH